MTLTESIIIIVGLAVVLVIAGLLLGNYLKHQNDHDPITGTTDVPPVADNTELEPNVPTPRKRNAKGQFVK